MFLHTAVLLTTGLVAAVTAQGEQFLDCPGNTGKHGLYRRCCTSDQLPKGCECYDILSSSFYTNTLLRKPRCPADINVSFDLYTRANRNTAQKIREDMNVVVVDWREGAKAPFYMQAAANTRTVGSMVGRLIQDMNSFTNSDFGRIHLIGHSLGAHIMGFAGKEVFRLTNQKVGRITGLDPAGLAYSNNSRFDRLDSTDGRFVDIIHTDSEKLYKLGFGITHSIGHVDFYPNGGEHQPGCPKENLGLFFTLSLEDLSKKASCSHSRVVDYFTNSISRCRYNTPDGNAACTMGYHVSTSCRDWKRKYKEHQIQRSQEDCICCSRLHRLRCGSLGERNEERSLGKGEYISSANHVTQTFNLSLHAFTILKEDMNVVVVDWPEGAKGPFYLQAAANTRTVGSMVGRLIQDMNSFTNSDFGLTALWHIGTLALDFAKKVSCSHTRVVDYFTNSISRCLYNPLDGDVACTIGYHVSNSCRGNNYLWTNNIAPFC
ncbi:Pancreatic lipase- protein 2 [Bulinus truncatus]|nr:Pancreatic lipase- protein 2 [Bulinus truncatus]